MSPTQTSWRAARAGASASPPTPLAPTIAGSWNRKTTSRPDAGAARLPIAKGTETTTAATRSNTPLPGQLVGQLVQQLGEARPDRPRGHQLVVLLAYAAALHRRAGADRAQHGVAWGVL